MRSIRLSLIVYFLILVSVALGVIGWLSYEATRKTLRNQEEAARDLLQQLYESRCQELRNEYDKRILQRAETLAGLAQSQFPGLIFHDLWQLGGASSAVNPHSHFLMPLWLGWPPDSPLTRQVRSASSIRIRYADDVLPRSGEGRSEEYFQVYTITGRPLQRSASLPSGALTLDPELREHLEPFRHAYGDVELRPGVQARVVTYRAPVFLFRPGFFRPPRERRPRSEQAFRPPPQSPPGEVRSGPQIFIQCACETTERDGTLAKYRDDLDQDLADREGRSQAQLAMLRRQFLELGLATFAAMVVGGLWLVELGLSPLRRLSDAVSRVTAKDFKLRLGKDPLPRELKPIAERLAGTLDQLRKAFEREKQAAADISHELRTPIAALIANADLALRKPRKAEEYREILEECRSSGRQINRLVERLLTLARLDAGVDALRVQEVDVSSLAETCAELIQPLAESHNLELSLHCPQRVAVRTDPDKLREVLSNLLHNAVEYNKPGGSIDVRVDRKNGSLFLEVADTGIGIPPEAREHIFERFYRADPSRQADGMHTGLGLAITKSYVDLLGGSIAVDSTVGAGSRFSVELPIR